MALQAGSYRVLCHACEVQGMSELIHYQDPQSRAVRTQTLLNFYNIPHKNVLIDIRKGDNKKPEYLKIHPHGRVPAIEQNGQVILESGAITLYLADLYADKMNTPKPGTPDRARFYEWMFFLHGSLEPQAMLGFNPETKEKGQKEVRRLLEGMASRLQGPHVLGEQFSVVDVVLYTELAWYKMIGLFPDGLEPFETFMKTHAERMTPALSLKA